MKRFEISGYEKHANVMTRQDVIDTWKNSEYLEHYVCPGCRDVLYLRELPDEDYDILICGNSACNNLDEYILRDEETQGG